MGVITGVRVKAEWVVFWNGEVITPPFWWGLGLEVELYSG